jgi:acetyltransferase-like isoleucine patch superfamily enzyme
VQAWLVSRVPTAWNMDVVVRIDMKAPILNIAIPTYNRCHLLRQTIEVLLPQLGDHAELLVSDNCSPDNTWHYLNSIKGPLVRHQHPSNVGLDENVYSCLKNARGDYFWLLGDDDLPVSNAVQCILEAIQAFNSPPVIYLRAKPSDVRISDYDDSPTKADWRHKTPSEFLQDVGVWATFMSSIVIRRDCIPLDFVKMQSGTSLTPTALILAAVGQGDGVVISNQPLVHSRGGNAGGYNAGTVFTRSLKELLKKSRQFGYSKESLDYVFNDSLVKVIPGIIEVWPFRWCDLRNIVLTGIGFPGFNKQVLPAYARKLKKQIRSLPGKMATNLARRTIVRLLQNQSPGFYEEAQALSDHLAHKSFTDAVKDLGHSSTVRHPIYLKNPKYFRIGNGFAACPGLRIEAWDTFEGEFFLPQIIIGNSVGLNWNVHIGAIDRIEIHDNVLIGSNVLITDHSHGQMVPGECDQIPRLRRLSSKGPVVIEENVWIGENVSILPNVTIGRGAIIGANSVVNKSVPAYTVVGGVPARVLKHLR